MTQQGDGILRGLLERERAIDVRGVPVALLLESDDAAVFRQQRKQLAERGLDGGAAPVEQDQRRTRSVGGPANLVVDAQPIDRRVSALRWRGAHRPSSSGFQERYPLERKGSFSSAQISASTSGV